MVRCSIALLSLITAALLLVPGSPAQANGAAIPVHAIQVGASEAVLSAIPGCELKSRLRRMVQETADCDLLKIELARGVSIDLLRQPSSMFQLAPQTGQTGAKTYETYVLKAPVSRRVWCKVMNRPEELVVDDGRLDEPLRGILWSEVAGPNGFVERLNTYLRKFSAAPTLFFDTPTAAQWAAEGASQLGFRLTATRAVPMMKSNLVAGVEAQCGLSNAQSAECNQTINGSLSTTDCWLSDNSYADLYRFSGSAGEKVTITLTSSEFDAYLLLWDSSGTKLTYNDDGGGGRDAKIEYTLPTSGDFYVGANSANAYATGSYRLFIGCGEGTDCTKYSNASCTTNVTGTLDSSDCQLDDHSYYDVYLFAGTTGQTLTIEMKSTAFDTLLVLIDPNGNIATYDDNGLSGSDSRIVYTLDSSGTWIIVANTMVPLASGSYTLTVSCGASCSYSLSSSSTQFGPNGGTGTAQIVGAPAGCNGTYTASTSASWITLTTGATGSGAGPFTLGYSVAAYSGSTRAGTITVGGSSITVTQTGGGPGTCTPSPTQACMLNDRFAVSVHYRGGFDDKPADTDALLKTVTGFDDVAYETAFFYFNSSNNIEMMVKLLDQGNKDELGRPTIALLFGSATPLRLELSITDTRTGQVKNYISAFNTMAGRTDFTAFLK